MASVLQVATIKDQGGNANAIEIANSSANVTINNLAGGTIGSGVTGQNRPYFVADELSNNPSISATGSFVELNTFVEATNGDPDSKFDTSTGRFTPGVAGMYLFGARIYFESNPSAFMRVAIRYNDGSSNSDQYAEVQDDVGTINITRMVYMNATGYVSCAAQAWSADRTLRGSECQFWGMRIA